MKDDPENAGQQAASLAGAPALPPVAGRPAARASLGALLAGRQIGLFHPVCYLEAGRSDDLAGN
jgi:hypothetical protein